MTILDLENNKSYLDKIEFRKADGTVLYTFLPDEQEDNLAKLGYMVNNFSIKSAYTSTYENKTLKYTYHHEKVEGE